MMEPVADDKALIEQLRRLVDNQTGGDALVLVQRQLFNKVVGTLVRLSGAEARIAKLLQDYDAAYNRGLIDGNRQSVEQQQAIHAAEARVEAAEALLKEAGTVIGKVRKALEPLVNSVFNDNGDITVTFTHITYEHCEAAYFADRAARAIHHKIGVKDE